METGHCVLIVDDDDALRGVVQDILEQEGYRVLATRSAAGAVGILGAEDVSLVLLDHMMPTAEVAARKALAERAGARPPIVLFSAVANAEQIAAAIGAQAWLPKPFEIEELLAIVRRYVRTVA